MSFNYEREEAILRAKGLLDGGYEPQSVYERLVSDGLSEDDAAEVMQRLTGKAHESAEGPASLSSLVEAPQAAEVAAPVSSENQQAQPVQNKASQFARQEAVRRAAALFDGGYDANYVQNKLVKEGFNPEEARAIVTLISQRPKQKRYQEAPRYQSGYGMTQVIIGVVMILLGIGITVVSYQAAASNPNGGTYVVTFGLVIAGIFRVIKGLSQ